MRQGRETRPGSAGRRTPRTRSEPRRLLTGAGALSAPGRALTGGGPRGFTGPGAGYLNGMSLAVKSISPRALARSLRKLLARSAAELELMSNDEVDSWLESHPAS